MKQTIHEIYVAVLREGGYVMGSIRHHNSIMIGLCMPGDQYRLYKLRPDGNEKSFVTLDCLKTILC